MEVKDWTKRELEKLYVNIFIIEETYVRKNEEIKKTKNLCIHRIKFKR